MMMMMMMMMMLIESDKETRLVAPSVVENMRSGSRIKKRENIQYVTLDG